MENLSKIKASLTREINALEKEINHIEPLYTKAKNQGKRWFYYLGDIWILSKFTVLKHELNQLKLKRINLNN